MKNLAIRLTPNKYVKNWLFIEHFVGLRYIEVIAIPLIVMEVILYALIKIVLTKQWSVEETNQIVLLINDAEKIPSYIYPWDIVLVAFLSWFVVARTCDRMFLFPTGKPIRPLIMWTLLPTIVYMKIRHLVLIILISPLFPIITKLFRPRTVDKVTGLDDMREDLNRLRDGRIEESNIWAEKFRLEDIHAFDRKAWSIVMEDYFELREILLMAKKQGCPVPRDILDGKTATNPDTDPTTYKAVIIYQDLRRALGYV
jgi:hypothetical protein